MLNGEVICNCNKCFMVLLVLCSWLFNEGIFRWLFVGKLVIFMLGDVINLIGFNSIFVIDDVDIILIEWLVEKDIFIIILLWGKGEFGLWFEVE